MLACVWSCSCCVLVVFIFWLVRWPGPLQNLCLDLFKLICTSFVIGLGALFTYLTNCKEPLKKCRLPHIKVTEINGYITGKHAVVMGQADIEFGPSFLSLLFFSWLSLPPNSPFHLHSIFYTLVLVGRRKGNLQSTASYLVRGRGAGGLELERIGAGRIWEAGVSDHPLPPPTAMAVCLVFLSRPQYVWVMLTEATEATQLVESFTRAFSSIFLFCCTPDSTQNPRIMLNPYIFFQSIFRHSGLWKWIYWCSHNNCHSRSCDYWLIHLGGYPGRAAAKAVEKRLTSWK